MEVKMRDVVMVESIVDELQNVKLPAKQRWNVLRLAMQMKPHREAYHTVRNELAKKYAGDQETVPVDQRAAFFDELAPILAAPVTLTDPAYEVSAQFIETPSDVIKAYVNPIITVIDLPDDLKDMIDAEIEAEKKANEDLTKDTEPVVAEE